MFEFDNKCIIRFPSFEIPADSFINLSVFDSPKGSSDTFKNQTKISLYFKRRHLII